MLFDKSAILTVQNHVITRNPRISVSHDKHRTWFLHINDVHEEDKGKYMCQINTAAAKTQYGYLHVVVPPMLWIPHQLVGAPLGYSVSLECYTEAHPTSLNYWAREDGLMIHESSKYKTTSLPDRPSYKTHMTLTIFDIQKEDYGSYKCIAKNPRGETDGTIRLYNWDIMAEMNNSVYGNPSSLTIQNEKSIKTGTKFQSNLNEIGKSEQKSSELDRKRNFNWPPDKDSATGVMTTVTLLLIALAVTIIR
ncbi:hypothetical protein P5V15_014643 [Pogonomyrmex californicus]